MIRTDKDYSRLLIAPLYVLAVYCLGMLVTEAAPIFLWLACSFFIFVLLDRPAAWLKKKRWPVALSAMLLTLTAVIVIGTSIYLFGYLLTGMVRELETSRQVFVDLFNRATGHWNYLNDRIAAFQPAVAPNSDISKVQIVEPSPLGGAVGGTILHGLGSAVSILTFALLVPILSFFLLAERDVLAKILRGAYAREEHGVRAWDKIVSSTQAFFVGNVVLGVVTFPLFAAVLYAFGVPNYLLIGGVASVLNLMPFAGAILAGFFPAVALYAATQSPLGPVVLYGICFVIHLVAADLITPKVLGSHVNINATTSTIAMVVWGEIWGGIGLIIAIPLMSIIKILFEHSQYSFLHWLAGLMSPQADEELSVSLEPRLAARET